MPGEVRSLGAGYLAAILIEGDGAKPLLNAITGAAPPNRSSFPGFARSAIAGTTPGILGRLYRHRIVQALKALGFTIGLLWLCLHGATSLGYNWQWNRVPDYLYQESNGQVTAGPLLQGAAVTLEIALFALAIASLLGLSVAILRLAPSLVGRGMAKGYVGLIRNTPLLIQLNLFYFIVAPVFDIGRLWTGILCLSVFEAAYASEIFRSGLLAVKQGQWEASASLGLSPAKTYRYVILPQALRIMLPPLTGIAVSLIKDSAIVSVIAVPELTTAARNAISASFMSFEIWFTVAAIYLVFTLSLSGAAAGLEKVLKKRLA
jgi:polar amino acid transport system permease protein